MKIGTLFKLAKASQVIYAVTQDTETGWRGTPINEKCSDVEVQYTDPFYVIKNRPSGEAQSVASGRHRSADARLEAGPVPA